MPLRAIACIFIALASGAAAAQAWPSCPVKVIVPFATGNGTDILGRLMADSFTRSMGSPFLASRPP